MFYTVTSVLSFLFVTEFYIYINYLYFWKACRKTTRTKRPTGFVSERDGGPFESWLSCVVSYRGLVTIKRTWDLNFSLTSESKSFVNFVLLPPVWRISSFPINPWLTVRGTWRFIPFVPIEETLRDRWITLRIPSRSGTSQSRPLTNLVIVKENISIIWTFVLST